jgi:hypothetical protein
VAVCLTAVLKALESAETSAALYMVSRLFVEEQSSIVELTIRSRHHSNRLHHGVSFVALLGRIAK